MADMETGAGIAKKQGEAQENQQGQEKTEDAREKEGMEGKPEAPSQEAGATERHGAEQGAKPDRELSQQELLTEIAKLKRLQERAAAEAADYKKKWKDTLSVQEQTSMEKAEEQAAKDAMYEEAIRERDIMKLTNQFVTELGYTGEQAKAAAIAQTDGDMETFFKIQKQVNEESKKRIEAEIYKSRPQLRAGTGPISITKEQFDKMSLVERSKLRREHLETYNALIGRAQ